MADVFVSYSRKDRDLVGRLHQALETKGRETWVDWEGIPPTAEWLAEIRAAVESADNFLFVLSPDSIASKVCRLELEHAVAHHKRLIPVVHREVSAADVPESLGSFNWIFFRSEDDFESAFETLLRALDTDLEWRKEHTRLLVRALQWDGRGRNDAFLLRGSDLKAGEAWLAAAGAQKEMRPAQLHGEYIAASRRGATKRLRMLLGSVAFAAIVAVVLAVLAFRQSRLAEDRRVLAEQNRKEAVESAGRADRNAETARLNADEARRNAGVAEERRREAEEQRQAAVEERNTALSRELATHSVLSLATDPELSLLLAREAARVRPTEQAEMTLRSAILQSHVRMVLRGHSDPVKTLGFRKDGKRLVTAASDVGLIWDAETGKPICELKGHTGTIWHAEFGADGKRVITTGDRAARIWNAETCALQHTLNGEGDFQVWAEFSPDGKLAVVAGRHEESTKDDMGRVWDVNSGKLLSVLKGHEEVVTRARVSPDASRFLTASRDKTARLWDADGKLVAVLSGHDEPVTTAAFSPDGRRVATAGQDGTTRIWSAEKGTPIAEVRGHTGRVNTVEFSGDGRWLLTASDDGTARVWEADAPGARQHSDPDMFDETKQVGWRSAAVLSGHRGSVESAVFHPDGNRVATAGADQTVRIWAPHTWDPERAFAAATEGTPLFEGGAKYLVTVPESSFNAARIWNMETGEPVGKPCKRAVFSPDGRWAATSHLMEKETKIWDTRSWKTAATLRGDAVSFSPDGKWLATEEGDHSLIWEIATWRRAAELPGKGGDFRHDARMFCGVGNHALLSWRAGTWEALPGIPKPGPFPDGCFYRPDGALDVRTPLSHTRDGRWGVQVLGDNLEVYHMPSGRLATKLESRVPQTLRDAIRYFTLSPTGRYAGAALLNGTARIWEMGTWRPVAVLRGHRGELHHLAFSADERFVATAGEDKTARIWDLSTGQSFAELRGHSGAVSGVAFSPDGRKVATMSEDGTALVYNCQVCAPMEELAAIAEVRVTRSLTAAERARFLHDESAATEDAETLLARARELASAGDVASATQLFERARQRGEKLFREPKREAELLAAEGFLAASTRHAERIELGPAIEARRRAKALGADQVKDPEQEVRKIAVDALTSSARVAAREGRTVEADRLIRRAQDILLKPEDKARLMQEWTRQRLLGQARLAGN